MNLVTIVLPPYKPTGIWFFFFLSHSVSLCPKGRAIINAESPVLQLCPGACWYSSEWQRLCVDHLTTCWREISNALSSHLLLSTPLLSFSSPLPSPLFLLLSPLPSSRSSKHRQAYVHLLPLTSGEREPGDSTQMSWWEREMGERGRLQMFLSVYLNKNTHPADSDKLTHTGTENLTRQVLDSPSLISVESCHMITWGFMFLPL